MATQFLILGPVAFERDGVPTPIEGRKAQSLMAALVISANHVVPVDRLIDAIWTADWPESPHHALQSQISKLRRRTGARIRRVDHGYVLTATCEQIDACRFERLVREADLVARDDAARALRAARSAVDLWRGPAFGELNGSELCQLEALRLDELRVGAQEIALEAMVALGLADEAVAELRAAVTEHPYRERLWRALFVGLIDLRRRGEAVLAYGDYRQRMEDLGLAPAPDLAGLISSLSGATNRR